MAFGNAKQILERTSGLSALKLLALTAQYSRPKLAPLSKLMLAPFVRDGAILVRYKQSGKKLKALVRVQDQESDLHSMLEVIARTVYPLDPTFEAEVVVDGGANIGLFTLQASATYPKATILLCEPLPRNVEQLRKHLRLNRIEAQLKPVCIGGEQNRIPFYCRHANASSFDGSEPFEKVLQIEVLRLGDILEEHVAERVLIKLDIEGLEVETLKQYVPTEERAVILFGELHHHPQTRPTMERLFAQYGWSFVLGDLSGSDAIFEARSPAAQALGLKQQELH